MALTQVDLPTLEVGESLRALTDLAFDRLDLNRVEIRIAPENARSIAIPRRLGFLDEGRLREVELVDDHYRDHLVFAMLRSDWSHRDASA